MVTKSKDIKDIKDIKDRNTCTIAQYKKENKKGGKTF